MEYNEHTQPINQPAMENNISRNRSTRNRQRPRWMNDYYCE